MEMKNMKSIKKILATLLLLTVIVSGVSSINGASYKIITGDIYKNSPGDFRIELDDECKDDYNATSFNFILNGLDPDLYGFSGTPFILSYHTIGELYIVPDSENFFALYKKSGLFTDEGKVGQGDAHLFRAVNAGEYSEFYVNPATHNYKYLVVS
jgi:hypothetical protein